MGNCGRKSLKEADDHKDVDNSVDTESPKDGQYKETHNEDEVKVDEPALILTNKENEEKHQTEPTAGVPEEYEDYYHVDNGMENYSEWDIIEFDCVTPLIDDDLTEVIGAGSVTSLADTPRENNIVPLMEQSMQIELAASESPTLQPRSRRSSSKVRFSESEGHQLYTVYENKESVDNNTDYLDRSNSFSRKSSLRDRNDTMSLQSYMSDVSTASLVANYDPVLAYRLSSAQIQVHFNYDPKEWLLRVGVKQIECSLDPMFQDLRVYWQVHMTLLPFKRQRLKTKYKGSSNPVFNQAFEVKMVDKSVLKQLSVRYRLYGRFGRAGRKRLAGEMVVELESLTKGPTHVRLEWMTLATMINEGTRRESLDSV